MFVHATKHESIDLTLMYRPDKGGKKLDSLRHNQKLYKEKEREVET